MKLNFNINFSKATMTAGTPSLAGCQALVPSASLMPVELATSTTLTTCTGSAVDSELDIFLNVLLTWCFYILPGMGSTRFT